MIEIRNTSMDVLRVSSLIHSFPMHPFSTPRKHQKTLRFFDVYRGLRKGALGTNGLKKNSTILRFFKKHSRIRCTREGSQRKCGALCDLVPFVQFKKCETHPWRSVNFSEDAG